MQQHFLVMSCDGKDLLKRVPKLPHIKEKERPRLSALIKKKPEDEIHWASL